MNSDRWIVVTSIQAPTEAIRALASIEGWQLLVVGDHKTPSDWQCPGSVFLSVDRQLELGFRTAQHLPLGHYARKSLGYLYAIREGAELLFDTDDDNRLIDSVPFVSPEGATMRLASSPDQFVNVYRLYTERRVWPRGFPLDHIRDDRPITVEEGSAVAPVQQALANNDPDVDAIFRLAIGDQFEFDENGVFALGPDQFCPFNSQATLWYARAYWALLLPAYVPMRATDIWRAYVAEALLHRLGETVAFTGPRVTQERNAHDLMEDFRQELPVYLGVHELLSVLANVQVGSPVDMLVQAYRQLHTAGVFDSQEVHLAEAWAYDFEQIGVHSWTPHPLVGEPTGLVRH